MSSLREVQRWLLDAILAHQYQCATVFWGRGVNMGERSWASKTSQPSLQHGWPCLQTG